MREPVAADEHDRDHRDREAAPGRRDAREEPIDLGVVREVRHELVDHPVRPDRA
jgi:hypothetical protein